MREQTLIQFLWITRIQTAERVQQVSLTHNQTAIRSFIRRRSWSGLYTRCNCRTCGWSSGGGATKKRQESSIYRLLIVKEEILWNPKRTMNAHNGKSNHRRRNQERSDTSEEHHNDSKNPQPNQRFEIRKSTATNNQRLIGRTENVEKTPSREEWKKSQERKRVGEKRKTKNKGKESDVIDTKVREVLADPGIGFWKIVRTSHRTPVDELRPWASVGETLADGGG